MKISKPFKKVLHGAFDFIGGTAPIRLLLKHRRGRGAILCYHRVLPDALVEADQSPIRGMAVTESMFIQQMRYLVRKHKMVSMNGMLDHLRSKSPEFEVTVTFDDGYKDNLECALPILKSYGIPATIYVTTRFPEGDCSMWWYELWELMESKRIIECSVDGQSIPIEVPKSYDDKVAMYYKLNRVISELDTRSVEEFMGQLRGNYLTKQYHSQCLSWDDIRRLDKEELITIGAHTHSHPNLKMLSDPHALLEIKQSRELLEKALGHPIQHFAYPFGGDQAASHREYSFIRDLEFVSGVTMKPELLENQDFNQLPRYGITNAVSPKKLGEILLGLSIIKEKMALALKNVASLKSIINSTFALDDKTWSDKG